MGGNRGKPHPIGYENKRNSEAYLAERHRRIIQSFFCSGWRKVDKRISATDFYVVLYSRTKLFVAVARGRVRFILDLAVRKWRNLS